MKLRVGPLHLARAAARCGALACLVGALAACGARTGLSECEEAEGTLLPCETICGAGVRSCFDGLYTPCEVPPAELPCATICGAGTQRCEEGELAECLVPPTALPCTNVCGEGLQWCEDGELAECVVAPVERPCETPCGSGTQWCEEGLLGLCSADAALPPLLEVRVRDFSSSHPDFEAEIGDDPGIVEPLLGDDDKPVYVGPRTVTTHGRESFDQWYRDVPGVNVGLEVPLELLPDEAGLFVFDDLDFFPIDGQGLGNEGREHNFHFTLEATTEFVYSGGEVFRFRGDDDVFVFIDRRLAIDLGGVHSRESATVELDEFAREHGLVVGQRYPLHLFFAERHTSESTFTVETTLAETFRCE